MLTQFLTSINQYVNQCLDLSETELAHFNSLLTYKKCPKKTLLLSNGEVPKFEAFIIKGCVKTYFINQEGKEVILSFAVENWWVGDVVHFQEQTQSAMFIETLEDTQMWCLNFQNKQKLLRLIPAFERMFRLMIQKNLGTYQNRLFEIVALTAEERYELFLKKYPNIPQRVSQNQIASYLGITPEFLSKIRNKKTHR